MTLRARTIRILLDREWLRLRRNPTAVLLLGLLLMLAILLATSRPPAAPGPATCWVVYWEDSPWIEHLRTQVPRQPLIRIVHESEVSRRGGRLVYPPRDHAIELRPIEIAEDRRWRMEGGGSRTETADNDHVTAETAFEIRYRFSGKDPQELQPYLLWFWPTTVEHFGEAPRFVQQMMPMGATRRERLERQLQESTVADLVQPELVGALLLFIAQFIAGCHLLVSFASQDRERGTLLALFLAPASSLELLIARYLFHFGLSLTLCVSIVAILKPATLVQPLLWTVLVLSSLGLMSLGTIIASLAKTQASASLLALCYLLSGGVIFYLSGKFAGFAWIKQLTFEGYTFLLLFQCLKQPLSWRLAAGLPQLLTLSVVWTTAAWIVFHRRGWR